MSSRFASILWVGVLQAEVETFVLGAADNDGRDDPTVAPFDT